MLPLKKKPASFKAIEKFVKKYDLILMIIGTIIGVIILFNMWCSFLKQREDLKIHSEQAAKSYFNKNYDLQGQGFNLLLKSHYNHPLRSCFLNIHYSELTSTDESKIAINVYDYLINVYEAKEYASNTFTTYKEIQGYKESFESCYIFDKRCYSQEEYDYFVRRYMENKN